MVLGQFVWTTLNQLIKFVRTLPVSSDHSSPNCRLTNWPNQGISFVRENGAPLPVKPVPIPGMLVMSPTQRAQGKPGGGPSKSEIKPALPLASPLQASEV